MEALELFLVTAPSDDLLVELIDHFVIPLSLAIITTGLLTKVGLDIDPLQDRYIGALERIRKLDADKKRLLSGSRKAFVSVSLITSSLMGSAG